MWPVEAARRARLLAQAAIRLHEAADLLAPAEPGGDAQVARHDFALCQEVGDLGVSPEQGSGEWRAALAVPVEVAAGAGRQQQAGEPEVVAVAGLVQRRPAPVVRTVRVGAARKQIAHDRLVAATADGVRRQAEQIVAVRAARRDEARIAVEQRAQRRGVACLDRAERPPERLPALGQGIHVAAKRGPAREAVLAREHEPGVGRAQRADLGVGRARERGVVGPHDRDPALEAALDDAA